MSGRLIVSVSGIKNDTYEHAAEFARILDGRGVPLSLLVAPRLKDKYRLAADVPTQEWLRTRRDGGDAIVLHGYDQAATKRRRSEFSALPRHEARLRLMAADRVMEQTGLRTRVFAAPRWIASPGAVEALPDAGFRMLAALNGIHDLDRDGTVRARVWGIGEGFKAEPWWFKALVLGAGRTARVMEWCVWPSVPSNSDGPDRDRQSSMPSTSPCTTEPRPGCTNGPHDPKPAWHSGPLRSRTGWGRAVVDSVR